MKLFILVILLANMNSCMANDFNIFFANIGEILNSHEQMQALIQIQRPRPPPFGELMNISKLSFCAGQNPEGQREDEHVRGNDGQSIRLNIKIMCSQFQFLREIFLEHAGRESSSHHFGLKEIIKPLFKTIDLGIAGTLNNEVEPIALQQHVQEKHQADSAVEEPLAGVDQTISAFGEVDVDHSHAIYDVIGIILSATKELYMMQSHWNSSIGSSSDLSDNVIEFNVKSQIVVQLLQYYRLYQAEARSFENGLASLKGSRITPDIISPEQLGKLLAQWSSEIRKEYPSRNFVLGGNNVFEYYQLITADEVHIFEDTVTLLLQVPVFLESQRNNIYSVSMLPYIAFDSMGTKLYLKHINPAKFFVSDSYQQHFSLLSSEDVTSINETFHIATKGMSPMIYHKTNPTCLSALMFNDTTNFHLCLDESVAMRSVHHFYVIDKERFLVLNLSSPLMRRCESGELHELKGSNPESVINFSCGCTWWYGMNQLPLTLRHCFSSKSATLFEPLGHRVAHLRVEDIVNWRVISEGTTRNTEYSKSTHMESAIDRAYTILTNLTRVGTLLLNDKLDQRNSKQIDAADMLGDSTISICLVSIIGAIGITLFIQIIMMVAICRQQ